MAHHLYHTLPYNFGGFVGVAGFMFAITNFDEDKCQGRHASTMEHDQACGGVQRCVYSLPFKGSVYSSSLQNLQLRQR